MAVRPIVAVVGRPNVGKSTLFNKLIGQRLSIVEDTPGVTRDRIYAACEWRSHEIMLVDTGGIEPYIGRHASSRRCAARPSSPSTARSVIILVVDVQIRRHRDRPGGCRHAAEERQAGGAVRQQVRRRRRAVPPEFYEFYNLGTGRPGRGLLGARTRHR